jgi:hypothetical protein
MRKLLLVSLVLGGVSLGGCALAAKEAPTAGQPGAPSAPALAAPDASQNKLPSTARKVIRNATLSIEVDSPATVETKVSTIVERLGGYVASSARDAQADEGERKAGQVELSLRVPSARLEEALREIKRFGKGAESEQIGSEDVTDEYIDLGARISNQRRLEEQLAKILTQASDVDGAMKVHRELTSVRTEIDRLEGRKQFLESESAMAKIALSLRPFRPTVGVSVAEIGVSARRASADAVSVAAGIVTFGIRAVGIVLPLSLMFGLPGLALFMWLRRRQRRATAALAA